jgi:CRP-like cAMP-binding protein
MKPKPRSVEPKAGRGFDVEGYLKSTGPARRIVKYGRGEVVFSQGDAGDDICYIQKGAIKLSVLSRVGKEAVVAMLAPGDSFGEGALAGQSVRIGTATAVVASSVLIIEREAMVRPLHEEPTFSVSLPMRWHSAMRGRSLIPAGPSYGASRVLLIEDSEEFARDIAGAAPVRRARGLRRARRGPRP